MKAMGAAQKLLGFVSLVSVSFFSYLFLVRIKKKIQTKEKEIEKEVYDGERKRENECSTPPNIDFPCELIENILLCLPVKDLLRCKCVSKSWFILICSTSFVNKHLEYCARSRTRVGLIVKENANDNWIRTVHLDDMPGNNQCDTVRVESCDPVHDTRNECKIVGSCNGLVCFTSKFDHITIWNPSTRKAHNLSCRPRGFEEFLSITETRFICGFGHDRISDDYKVIELEGDFVDITSRFCTQIWVYSLKTKSWTISSSPYFLSKQQISFVPGYGIFAGNALHWIMERRDFNLNDYRRYLIGALDIGADNQFYEVQKPDYCDSNNIVLINLGVLDGCLCVCSGRPTTSIDIWVMKEYGVKESWTRLISFSTISPSFYGRKMPLAYSSCGHKLMLHDCSNINPVLIWYDLKTENVTSVPLLGSNLKDVFFARAYIYSLVNPCN